MYMNPLEMRSVFMTITAFQEIIIGQALILKMDNACEWHMLTNKGTVSQYLRLMTQEILERAVAHTVEISARHTPGWRNTMEDQLNHNSQIISTEWSLLPRVFKEICKVHGRTMVDLSVMQKSHKLPVYDPPVPNPWAW